MLKWLTLFVFLFSFSLNFTATFKLDDVPPFGKKTQKNPDCPPFGTGSK